MIFMAHNHGQYDNWEGWYLRYDDNGDDDGDGEDDHDWLIDWLNILIDYDDDDDNLNLLDLTLCIRTPRPKENGRLFADNVLKIIFREWKLLRLFSNKLSLLI